MLRRTFEFNSEEIRNEIRLTCLETFRSRVVFEKTLLNFSDSMFGVNEKTSHGERQSKLTQEEKS